MRYNGKLAGWALTLALVFSYSVNGAMAQDAATSASATGGQGGGGRGGRGGGLWGAALQVSGLTAEQKEKLEKGQTESREKMQEMRKNASGGTFDREAYTKIQDEQKTQINAILNDDQKKEFETKAAEARSRMGAGRGARGGAGQTSGTQNQ